MGLLDNLRNVVTGSNADSFSSTRKVDRGTPNDFEKILDAAIQRGGQAGSSAAFVKELYEREKNDFPFSTFQSSMLNNATATGGFIGINDYGIKGRRMYSAERRRLLDLYSIALNNGDLRTAITHLRNEIFRRGLEWEPAFDYKCDVCEETYTEKHAKRMNYRCDCTDQEEFDEQKIEDIERNEADPVAKEKKIKSNLPKGPKLRKPDVSEIKEFDKFLDHANYFGQSLENILRSCEDDINIVDDAFLYFRKKYMLSDHEIERAREDPFNDEYAPDFEVMQIFRLDPTLVEYDMDDRGIPGQGHHLCVFHRDDILDVPSDEGWDLEWKGTCPTCGLRTYPVYYVYNEQQGSTYGGSRPKLLYLLEDEVIHWSRYSPTETYGFAPVLSIYEKAMTLIGMDRYLYDYFYERRVPQGVVTVTTDDVTSFNATKMEVEARMQQDPHYIPWMAIASKTGQGKMEFVRFAYSLDELDYLPVRDEIRERIAGIYGVSQVWMQSSEGIGGLNNESQQITVMNRVVEGAQRSYATDVFVKLKRALKIYDWNLSIRTPEESNELVELQIFQTRAAVAQTMAGMGFGVEFNAETEEFTYSGRILSMEEQQKQQMEQANPFGAGGGMGGGGGLGAMLGGAMNGPAGGGQGGQGAAMAPAPVQPPAPPSPM